MMRVLRVFNCAGVETLTVLDGQFHASSVVPIGRCAYALTHDLSQLRVDIARSSKKSNNNLTDAALKGYPKTREFVKDLDMSRQGNRSSID